MKYGEGTYKTPSDVIVIGDSPLYPRKRTYVAFVLDKSGSMDSVKEAAISGFNEQVQTVRANAEKGGDTKVSLVLFDHNVYEQFFSQSPDRLIQLTSLTYKPSGNTAMYDAVAHTINKLLWQPGAEDAQTSFLVIVVSDGLENASQHYTGLEIAERVKKLQDTNRWTFVYVGANQNLAEIEKHLGFKRGNVLQWTATPDGTTEMYAVQTSGTLGYFVGRAAGQTATNDFFTGIVGDVPVPTDPTTGSGNKDNK